MATMMGKNTRGTVFGQVTAITVGVLGSGGLGFYWIENYKVKDWEKQVSELEKELEELTLARQEKERSLKKC